MIEENLKIFENQLGIFPQVSLGDFPTPIKGPFFWEGHEIWIKRDDLSAEIHGGNKVRKLEFALAQALEEGKKEVVLCGARGSNWCVAGIIFARQQGLKSQVLLYPQPETDFSRRNFEFTTANADGLVEMPHVAALPFYLKREKRKNSTFLLPPGGTSSLSNLGYVKAWFELIGQMKNMSQAWPDEIWLPLGTGGTVAGLLAGLSLLPRPLKICAVRVVDRVVSNRLITLSLARKTLGLWKENYKRRVFLRGRQLKIYHYFFGKGYGRPTRRGKWAMKEIKSLAGIEIEPTYTAKTAAAMFSHLKASSHPRRVLFWNTYNSRQLP